MRTYDTIIVGGGPAGLAAAIHLGWHGREVLVIDRRSGPLFFTLEELHNVPGMPAVRGIDLQRRLRQQAIDLGVETIRANVVRAGGALGAFRLEGEKDEQWAARTLLLATGVARYHPGVDGEHRPCFRFAGKGNLFYCPDCEAPQARDKDIVVIGVGPADWAAGMALGLSTYAKSVRVLLTEETDLTGRQAERLEGAGIEVIAGEIVEKIGTGSHLETLRLRDDSRISADAFFVSSPALGRTDLAQQLGVELADSGHHARPRSQRGDTDVDGVWIAGDLRPMTQQVAVAMGTGNVAAVMIDQYLRKTLLRDI